MQSVRLPGRRPRSRLTLLQLHTLSIVLLLELLRLLSVALLHLLLLRVIVVFLGCLLMFFLLLLLELLVILRLLGGKFLLLLLVLFVGFRVAGIWRRVGMRLQLTGVSRLSSAWARFIGWMPFCAPVGIWRRSLVFAAGLPGLYDPGFEVTCPGSGCNGRLALVGGSP